MTPRFHTLRIAEVRRETPEAVSLRFEVPRELAPDYAFTQGQHITLRARLEGEELRRSYSICAGVDDAELRVAIKKVPGGVFSTYANAGLKRGDAIDVLTPEGRFHTALDPANAKHYVALAAGSGITPVLSLIKTTLKREPRSRFTLLYGNRRVATAMFQEELEDLKDRYLGRLILYNLFSRERQDVDLFNGRLDAAKLKAFADALLPVDTIDEAYVCGPGAMLDELEAALRELGMPPEHIHLERFGLPGTGPAHHAEPGDAAQALVTVILDGGRREVEFHREDASLLEAALREGLDLPYSCKGGMCCTCRAKVLEGKVRMDKNYSLEQRDLDAGFVLACQAHPLTDRVVISYDER
jgi:ring-1,2-phenylacetyl-CoA epoxidase subunit PaaE